MPDTSVKYFHSGLTGAPVLSGTAGSLVAVLDACLVNGFAVSAVASLVVASNIATATISGGHSAEVGSVVLVSGATPSGLNSEKKVLSVGAGNTTLTFDAPRHQRSDGQRDDFAETGGRRLEQGIYRHQSGGVQEQQRRGHGLPAAGRRYRGQDRTRRRLRDDDRHQYRQRAVSDEYAAQRRVVVDQEHGGGWQLEDLDAGRR
jgi:hypothetical protein